MITPLYTAIKELLESERISYEETTHEPVYTADQARDTSGHADDEGTKSLVLALPHGAIAIATVAGGDRVDFDALKRTWGVKKVSMSRDPNVLSTLGSEPGGVSPFGYTTLVRVAVSRKLFRQPHVFFNAGRNDVTMKVTGKDFERVMTRSGATVLP